MTVVMVGLLPMAATFAAGDKVEEGLNSIQDPFPDSTIVGDGTVTFAEASKNIIEYALYFSAIVAVFYIIYGGYQYIFSGGSDDKAKAGRKTLVNALIGLVMIILAFVIVRVVYTFITQ